MVVSSLDQSSREFGYQRIFALYDEKGIYAIDVVGYGEFFQNDTAGKYAHRKEDHESNIHYRHGKSTHEECCL